LERRLVLPTEVRREVVDHQLVDDEVLQGQPSWELPDGVPLAADDEAGVLFFGAAISPARIRDEPWCRVLEMDQILVLVERGGERRRRVRIDHALDGLRRTIAIIRGDHANRSGEIPLPRGGILEAAHHEHVGDAWAVCGAPRSSPARQCSPGGPPSGRCSTAWAAW